ncbi:glycosyltransferase family 4 protein [Pontimicrobium sp. IMCC45349]|uniref:glycosyltransferase family 4 protein n=1 Tax=Pontimicrobium sp. IMCC45349 TaxID=3391574 RepID=UPI0039A07F27
MHIAFLTPEYPHEKLNRSGGLGTSIKNLAMALLQKDVKVTVFVVYQSKNEEFEDEGVIIKSIAHKKYPFLGWYLERKRIQKIVQKDISENAINLIEAPDWTGVSAFMRFSIPLVIRIHGSDAYFCHLENRKQKWKNYFQERNALTNANAIISVSDFSGALTTSIFKLKKKTKTIYNGIDIDKFSPSLECEPNQILYFGTLVRKKGVLELAQIFNLIIEKNPEAKLLLIGKDNMDVFEKKSTLSLFKSLLSSAASQQLNYIPEVPYNQVKSYISNASVVVLPSFAEAFPMTWLETMAMEKPLVASNIGWSKELIENGITGYAINPTNHKTYAETIKSLLEDKTLCHKVGKAARQKIVNEFSMSLVVDKNIEYYKHIISKR